MQRKPGSRLAGRRFAAGARRTRPCRSGIASAPPAESIQSDISSCAWQSFWPYWWPPGHSVGRVSVPAAFGPIRLALSFAQVRSALREFCQDRAQKEMRRNFWRGVYKHWRSIFYRRKCPNPGGWNSTANTSTRCNRTPPSTGCCRQPPTTTGSGAPWRVCWALKASRVITHYQKLRRVKEPPGEFTGRRPPPGSPAGSCALPTTPKPVRDKSSLSIRITRGSKVHLCEGLFPQ